MPPPLPEDDSELEDFDLAVRGRSHTPEDQSSAAESVKEETPPPKRGACNGAAAVNTKGESEEEGENDDAGEDDDEDEEEEEFVVEAIKKHIVTDGQIQFQVKWEGYEKKADMTWEPEESLREGAEDIVEAYLKKLGGRDAILDETTKASRGKKRGKPSGAASGTDTPASTKRSRKSAGHPADAPAPASSKPWSPPAGSWEDEIEEIQTEKDPTTSKLIVYLLWKNGKRTKHDTSVIYKKCPQKMLRFYEQHVRVV